MKDQDASLQDLLEVRMGLECNAAALASKRADTSDLKAMTRSIEEMMAEIKSGRMGTEADTAFHMAIAYAGKNSLHILIMRNFYDYLFLGIKENLASLYETPENIEIILKQHKAIFDAIKGRDPEAAYAAMHEHISYVMDHFRRQAE
nr:FCD domain-containing protein [Desulfospira joergensenii]